MSKHVYFLPQCRKRVVEGETLNTTESAVSKICVNSTLKVVLKTDVSQNAHEKPFPRQRKLYMGRRHQIPTVKDGGGNIMFC